VFDAMMPGEEWKKTVEQILKDRPEAGVIITSGFSREFVRHDLPIGAWQFLQKPFSPDDILESVREAAGQPVSAGDAAAG